MSKAEKTTSLKHVDYGTCLDECIAVTLREGPEVATELYKCLPKPSPKQWAECVQEVANEPSESINNSFHLIGRWEIRMHKKGIRTTLGLMSVRFANSIVPKEKN